MLRMSTVGASAERAQAGLMEHSETQSVFVRRENMVHVIASVSVQEGRKEEFLDIFKANVPKVRQERGCIEYAPCVDLPAGLPSQDLEGQVVTVVEKWSSLEDLQAHLAAPHMQEYKERVKDMVLATSIKVLQEV